MNRCPITYEVCGTERYSQKGLHLLSRNLNQLRGFPYTAQEQRNEAVTRAVKMSIQGVQPKLSAVLKVKEEMFQVVDTGGKYILKPQNIIYLELPENEDLTMKLAKTAGIEVPLHGLICSKDGSLTYFIKRFDRMGRNRKLPVEDFAQLAGLSRDTKYKYSMEKIVHLLDYCTFPALEKLKLFRLTVFNYLIGNEDMHLKNFSLITRSSKVEISPAYDLINTTIAQTNPEEEIALPIHGKKRNLTRNDLIKYFGEERLRLNQPTIRDVLDFLHDAISHWQNLIEISFLSDAMKLKYLELIETRRNVLGI
ncbi:MAG: HipA domain-containing protein [Candidatus Marinimicrobia bacterium]|nr:HipA domain-containing protein [Candidatus Neomarinimicrobiota bacterium]